MIDESGRPILGGNQHKVDRWEDETPTGPVQPRKIRKRQPKKRGNKNGEEFPIERGPAT